MTPRGPRILDPLIRDVKLDFLVSLAFPLPVRSIYNTTFYWYSSNPHQTASVLLPNLPLQEFPIPPQPFPPFSASTMTRSASGERKRRLIRSLDYQCVRRFRLRRLLSFLWRYSYHEAFEAYEPYASLPVSCPFIEMNDFVSAQPHVVLVTSRSDDTIS